MISFQEILKNEWDNFLRLCNLSSHQLNSFYHILHCHTEKLGFNYFRCEDCGHIDAHYNSCRDRNCPMCQCHQREQWVSKFASYLLDIPYFHIVFTLPAELNPIIYQNQSVAYKILFDTVSQTLINATSKTYGKIGFTCILHTWGQNLSFHPHIHCIVTGGGLFTDDHDIQSFKCASSNFLVSVRVLSELFRGKFLDAFKKADLDFFNECTAFQNPLEFNRLISNLYKKDWVVYSKIPFGNNKAVLEYIGRYSHRVAISNNRILDYDKVNHTVTFSYKDYKQHSKRKRMTLSAVEFLRRFSMHILPSKFMKIRHFGLLANSTRNTLIPLCRSLLPSSSEVSTFSTCLPSETKHAPSFVSNFHKCTKCGGKVVSFFNSVRSASCLCNSS